MAQFCLILVQFYVNKKLKFSLNAYYRKADIFQTGNSAVLNILLKERIHILRIVSAKIFCINLYVKNVLSVNLSPH